ncbi:20437_t:CDS:1 [Funneliformis geosporum]|uniref:19854_t:CDS:1 n=1 Tax=Funneliformis geosporum TaxID=1117311 RepID=A0A9W4SHL4_9GLOM|nr:19854_t:CDS:1 [Funneliformis geosporum]CAI2188766.1 20437_t:CDS:1 [Funneliformis geosporum]
MFFLSNSQFYINLHINSNLFISSLCSKRTFHTSDKLLLYSKRAVFRKRNSITQKTRQPPTKQTLPRYHGSNTPSGSFSVDRFKINNNLKSLNSTRQQKRQIPTNKYIKPSIPVSKKTRGYIPAKFKLLPIESDVKLTENKQQNASQTTKNDLSDKQKTSRQENSELLNLKGKSTKLDSLRLEHLTFESMNLRQEVLEAIRQGPLKEVKPLRPTEIQALTIPEILNSERQHILCAAETGSGKTLAYLLPIINKIKDQEIKAPPFSSISTIDGNEELTSSSHEEKESEQSLFKSSIRQLNRPRAIVLLPSRELVEQVLSVSKHLSHFAKFRPIAITSHKNRRFVRKTLLMPTDLVVATPAGLIEYIEGKNISLSETRYLVIDEADTMFNKGFDEDVSSIIEQVKRSNLTQDNRPFQVIVVTATLPKSVNEMLSKELPFMKRLTSHSLHKSLPNLSHNFIDLKQFNYNKLEAIIQILKTYSTSASTMIFCNRKLTAERLEAFLHSKSLPVIGLYGDIDDRTTKLESFRNQEPHAKILVCTDLASRGFDTTFVDHVILFDFPTTVVDFLHRVGRTARAGKRGKATYFVSKKNRELAERIKRNIRDRRVLS